MFKKAYKGFIELGDFLGRIMSRVILFVLFISVVFAVWLFSKIFRKQFLNVKLAPRLKSYWLPVDKEFNDHTLEKWELPY